MNEIFWDVRYSIDNYAYGVKPNQFLKQILLEEKVDGKSILFPAEGEGRNAVYAAGLGMQTFAFDFSVRGKEKAEELAKKKDVEIDYMLSQFSEYQPTEKFDYVGLFFAHFDENNRVINHQKVIDWLKPGGKIILGAFSKEQLKYNSGGPKKEDMLYSIEALKKDFGALEIESIIAVEKVLDEGQFHKGKASLLRMIASKPE